jgi:hypothetical protein
MKRLFAALATLVLFLGAGLYAIAQQPYQIPQR